MDAVTFAVERVVHQEAWGVIVRGPDVGIGSEPEEHPVTIRMTRRSYRAPPVVGEVWSAEGVWKRTQYGVQLVAETAVRVQPSGRWVVPFFQARIDGIGPERARRLREHFGDGLIDVLDLPDADAVGLLAPMLAPRHPRLGTCLAKAMLDAWREVCEEARTLAWLDGLGITNRRICNRLFALFKDRLRPTLEENPYLLVSLFERWAAVDLIGLRVLAVEPGAARPEHDRRRLLGAVDSAVKDAVRRGHTALEDDTLRREVAARLGARGPLVKRALAIGKVNHAIVRGSGEKWRAPGCAFLEDGIAARFGAMMAEGWRSTVPKPTVARFVQEIAAYEQAAGEVAMGISLTPEQRGAVLHATTHQLSVLTGGAGTGKTSTVGAICHVWTALGGSVVLTALAGKAVLNLGSKTDGRYPARTIVRLLKEIRHPFSQQIKGVDLDNRTLLVVDEASMVDVGQWHALLEVLPEGAHLLAVGDPNQLPPIGPGLVFERLVSVDTLTTRLEAVHRQNEASGIPAVARSIRERVLPDLPTLLPKRDGVFLVEAEDEGLQAAVADVVEQLGGFPLSGSHLQIIVPTNGGHPASVEELNDLFHRRRVDTLVRAGRNPAVLRAAFGRSFVVGDPVIHLRNDYARGLCNGTLGRVREVREDAGALLIDFFGEEHLLTEDDTVDVALAYAVTAHKAQGSSAETVVIPVYDSRVLDRTWLYTAVTRAERRAVLVGRRDLIEAALTRPSASDRRVTDFRLLSYEPPTFQDPLRKRHDQASTRHSDRRIPAELGKIQRSL